MAYFGRKRNRPRLRKTIVKASPAPRERRPRPKPIDVVNDRFSAALAHFGAALLETSSIAHSVIKGTKREDAFRNFLAQRLPGRYDVASGEVIDQLNVASPQLDALVFDKTKDFSFSEGDVHILPAEALLASFEVKSGLNSNEVASCCSRARKLRSLKPFRVPLGGKDVGQISERRRQARYFHCVFAYETDLVQGNWLQSEARRFSENSAGDEHLVDAVYVLGRGLLNLNSRKGRLEDARGSAITNFYFSILNFIQREANRRAETPYSEYASLLGGEWIPLRKKESEIGPLSGSL